MLPKAFGLAAYFCGFCIGPGTEFAFMLITIIALFGLFGIAKSDEVPKEFRTFR